MILCYMSLNSRFLPDYSHANENLGAISLIQGKTATCGSKSNYVIKIDMQVVHLWRMHILQSSICASWIQVSWWENRGGAWRIRAGSICGAGTYAGAWGPRGGHTQQQSQLCRTSPGNHSTAGSSGHPACPTSESAHTPSAAVPIPPPVSSCPATAQCQWFVGWGKHWRWATN